MAYDHREHTVAENREMARILGDHMGRDRHPDPVIRRGDLAAHFVVTGLKCPLCLDEAVAPVNA